MKTIVFSFFALIFLSSAVHSKAAREWSEFVSPEYNFKITFPGPATETEVDGRKGFIRAIKPTNLPPKSKLDKISQLYVVTIQNVPEQLGLSADQVLDKYDNWKALGTDFFGQNAELKSEEITVEGYPARQYTVRFRDSDGKSFMVNRILLARGRIYFFGVSGGSGATADINLIFNERVRKFMDSFQLIR